MTTKNREDVLKKAIEKAMENGYVVLSIIKPQYEVHGWDNSMDVFVYQIIFSHEFAKAFWGDKVWNFGYIERINEGAADIKTGWCWFTDIEKRLNCNYCEVKKWLPAWKYHLQQMVVKEDPLEYLEKYL